jgi:hypothetical protein
MFGCVEGVRLLYKYVDAVVHGDLRAQAAASATEAVAYQHKQMRR